jgi:Tat protein secretion system quality control protein TatD with DNase activity
MAGAGIHPWFAHQPKSSDWATRLGALLEAQPRLIVGEIGLDKVARTPDTRTTPARPYPLLPFAI